MKLRVIAGGPCRSDDEESECGRDDCPTVFVTDRGTIAVQGDVIDRHTPLGEGLVEIPEQLLREAVRALGG